MSSPVEMEDAARRNLAAAATLAETGRPDVAGYLYGIAAECAVKAMARGIPAARSKEIQFAHFPELRTLLLDVLQGRSAQPLLRVVEPAGFMNEWHVSMRYASAAEVRRKPIDKWAEQARQAVNTMGT